MSIIEHRSKETFRPHVILFCRRGEKDCNQLNVFTIVEILFCKQQANSYFVLVDFLYVFRRLEYLFIYTYQKRNIRWLSVEQSCFIHNLLGLSGLILEQRMSWVEVMQPRKLNYKLSIISRNGNSFLNSMLSTGTQNRQR